MRIAGVPPVVVLEPPTFAGWPRTWLLTGEHHGSGWWRHPARWVLLCRVILGYVSEFREHTVLARTQAVALECLKRDLRAEEEETGEPVRLVQVCRIQPPLSPAEIADLERANRWLQSLPQPAWLRPVEK